MTSASPKATRVDERELATVIAFHPRCARMVESFAATHLKPGARVLHVIRGARTELIGFDVTTVDGSQLASVHGVFDAVVFTDSLSTVASLPTTIDQAARLLAPSGRVIVEDIDVAAPDAISLRWFYDVHDLLAVAGVLSRVHSIGNDLNARWRSGVGAVHSGTHMRVAVSARFVIRELRRVEGFYRLLACAPAIVAHVRAVERRSIASDNMIAVGLRIVADCTARD